MRSIDSFDKRMGATHYNNSILGVSKTTTASPPLDIITRRAGVLSTSKLRVGGMTGGRASPLQLESPPNYYEFKNTALTSKAEDTMTILTTSKTRINSSWLKPKSKQIKKLKKRNLKAKITKGLKFAELSRSTTQKTKLTLKRTCDG